MTHTPGPWKAHPADTDSTPHFGHLATDIWGITDSGDTAIVARVYHAETTAQDNENLILAAPDLLEACEVANRFFEQNDDFTDGEYPIPGFILDMRIAIKKARRTPLTKATGREEEL